LTGGCPRGGEEASLQGTLNLRVARRPEEENGRTRRENTQMGAGTRKKADVPYGQWDTIGLDSIRKAHPWGSRTRKGKRSPTSATPTKVNGQGGERTSVNCNMEKNSL